MTNQKEVLNKKKGAFYSILYNSESGILKRGKEENLIKEVRMCIRTGINRDNIQYVIDHPVEKSDSTREFWGVYINDRIVKHKDKDVYYLKAYLKKNAKCKVTYYLNGVEVDKEYLKENKYISSSERASYNEVGDLFLPLDKITFI